MQNDKLFAARDFKGNRGDFVLVLCTVQDVGGHGDDDQGHELRPYHENGHDDYRCDDFSICGKAMIALAERPIVVGDTVYPLEPNDFHLEYKVIGVFGDLLWLSHNNDEPISFHKQHFTLEKPIVKKPKAAPEPKTLTRRKKTARGI